MTANPDYLSVELTRRQRALIRAAGTQSVVLVCSAPRRYRSNDVEHRYRQNSDFAYLTGLAEIDALAVFVPGSARAEYTLFYTPPKPEQVIWEGGGLSTANIKKSYGVERIHPKEQFDEIFPQMLAGKKRLYCSFDQAGTSENMVAVIRTLRQARRAKASLDELIALETLSHPLRLKKSGFEMRLIKKAVDIAVTSHENNMRLCRPGLSERDIEAQILKTLRENDAHPSYPPIVASGANACTLHYTKNNAALRDNQLLLVDAGAEYRLYASDITRTYPINGRFHPPQRELYELVLEAQLAAIKQVRPGSCWSEVHRAAIQVLVRGLRSLKILRGEIFNPDAQKSMATVLYARHRSLAGHGRA